MCGLRFSRNDNPNQVADSSLLLKGRRNVSISLRTSIEHTQTYSKETVKTGNSNRQSVGNTYLRSPVLMIPNELNYVVRLPVVIVIAVVVVGAFVVFAVDQTLIASSSSALTMPNQSSRKCLVPLEQ